MAPDAQLPVFKVTALGGGGLTRGQTRSRRFMRPSRGVVVDLTAENTSGVADQAALLGCRADAILSDVSAAAAWGLPLPPHIGLALDDRPRSVAVPADQARPKRAGVRGRRLDLPEEHLTTRDGVALSTPARTWLDCAALIPIEHVVAMGDVILRRDLASLRELEDVVTWGRGRRGVVPARRSLPILDPRAESPGESLVRAHCLLAGIPRPQCNLNVVGVGGWIGRVDLAWVAEKVIVEYDGAVHLPEAARRHDAARRNALQDAGWFVIVLTARDLATPWEMCALINRTLIQRRRSPS